MLSKVSTLIIGIIDEKPLNPYEISKVLDSVQIKNWFPVAASSIYSTIKILEKKGYITGEVRKDGNMPEKTIYTITDEGRAELLETIEIFISTVELDSVTFNIASMLMCHLDKNRVLELLSARKKKFEISVEQIKTRYQNYIEVVGVPAYMLGSQKHNAYLMEAEIKTTEELIIEIEKHPGWNHFIAKPVFEK